MPGGQIHAGFCNMRIPCKADRAALGVSFALHVCYTDNNYFRKNIYNKEKQ